jgi:hypothetical protein
MPQIRPSRWKGEERCQSPPVVGSMQRRTEQLLMAKRFAVFFGIWLALGLISG